FFGMPSILSDSNSSGIKPGTVQKRRATTLEAAPQSMRRPVSLRGGQLTSGRVSLGRPEVLEAQVVDGQVRLAPAAELLDADPRGIGRLGGGELQADPLRLAGLWERQGV